MDADRSLEGPVERFLERGVVVIDDLLGGEEVAYWRSVGEHLRRTGGLRPAGVGRGDGRMVRPEIRGDAIAWIEPDPAHAFESRLMTTLERLRLAINARCLLGLLDIEMHLAAYPPGGFYRAHVDRFGDDDARVVSMVVYLNTSWSPEDGGLLRLWPEGRDAEPVAVEPRGGRAVLFLAGETLHEVLETRVERWSLTGWFRRRRA